MGFHMSNIMNHPLVVHAQACAADAHKDQKRKYDGQPYIVHPQRVAARVAKHGGTPEMVAAALLHDTIEDTWVTYEYLLEEFGPEVADLVQELSDEYTHEAYPELNRAERKRLEARRLATISVKGQSIKYCDLIDNTWDITMQDPGFAKKYLQEKEVILDEMNAGDEELYDLAWWYLERGQEIIA
jgi:(p)ppGpp synthase/HD superfamily hydrolase